jgi:S1-C subfamily serine protease
LAKVDRAIADRSVRAVIRRVQPACVRLNGASGVCISPAGTILTAAHVPEDLGARQVARFPDGKSHWATCTAIDHHLDVAVMQIRGERNLPYAPIARQAPVVGTEVVVIGQPGSRTPDGDPTGYESFEVSTGEIRGFKGERLGSQALGGTKHDAWTYWGHSGSPLFDHRGSIVAMHNSWDSTTAMRHAVTHEAIVYFLKKVKADYVVQR